MRSFKENVSHNFPELLCLYYLYITEFFYIYGAGSFILFRPTDAMPDSFCYIVAWRLNLVLAVVLAVHHLLHYDLARS